MGAAKGYRFVLLCGVLVSQLWVSATGCVRSAGQVQGDTAQGAKAIVSSPSSLSSTVSDEWLPTADRHLLLEYEEGRSIPGFFGPIIITDRRIQVGSDGVFLIIDSTQGVRIGKVSDDVISNLNSVLDAAKGELSDPLPGAMLPVPGRIGVPGWTTRGTAVTIYGPDLPLSERYRGAINHLPFQVRQAVSSLLDLATQVVPAPGVILTKRLPVYDVPDVAGSSSKYLDKGTRLQLVGWRQGWLAVKSEDGAETWMTLSEFLSELWSEP